MTESAGQSRDHSLSEGERLAYLQAMEIPLWIPRELTDAEHDYQQQLALLELRRQDEVDSPELSSITPDSSSADQIDSNGFVQSAELTVDEKNPLNSPQTIQPEKNRQLNNISLPESAKVTADTEQIHYLKMVNWSNEAASNAPLLIICRHQVDQPAQSFAKANAPSQFMRDYLQALTEFAAQSSLAIPLRLAHLAQVGLSAECKPLQDILTTIKPKLVLVLGDEAVKALFSESLQIAALRGQLISLSDEVKCLVSYHPFTLIQNPQLKKLALDDLRLIARFFSV